MIDRLWPDRLPISDITMGISPKRADDFDEAYRKETLRRQLRVIAKRLFYKVTKRKVS